MAIPNRNSSASRMSTTESGQARKRPLRTKSLADEYCRMKERLIAEKSYDDGLAQQVHLTERDLDKHFARNSDPSPFEKARATVTRLRKEKLGNGDWWRSTIRRSVPVLGFIANYRRSFLLDDIAAGLSVGVAAIPMGMSYAMIAGLKPEHGLYNDLFYCFFYMLLGTGRQIAVGVSAIEAMLTAEACARVVGWDAQYEDWLNCAFGVAFFVGFTLLLFRLFNAGVVSRILADPVLSGFSTGSAITIASSQLTNIFGISVPRQSTFFTWLNIARKIGETNWRCVLITGSGICILVIVKRLNRRYFKRFPIPGALFVLIIFIALGYFADLSSPPHNVRVVGPIPQGFPTPKMFDFQPDLILPIFGQAIIYSIMFFVIHISIAKTLAQQNGYTLDANQEFFAVGTAGLIGSFFQCYPVATSVSRSSIANATGAKTPLWNVCNVLLMVLTITVLTPMLSHMPLPALSAVIVFGVKHMMFFSEGWRLLRLWSVDFILWASCCFATIFWGAMEGVIVGVVLSLLWLLKKNAFPVVAVLGRLPGTLVYRDITRFPEAEQVPGLKIIRFDSSLNFCNAEEFEAVVVRIARLNKDSNDMRDWNFACFSKPPQEKLDAIYHANKYNAKQASDVFMASQPTREGSVTPRDLAHSHHSFQHKSYPADRPNTVGSHFSEPERSDARPTSGQEGPIKVLIIDASSINDLDITAIRMLENLAQRAAASNKVLLFANWKGPMRDYLHRLRFYEVVPPEHCFLSIIDAVVWAQAFYLNSAIINQLSTTGSALLRASGCAAVVGGSNQPSGASRYCVEDSPIMQDENQRPSKHVTSKGRATMTTPLPYGERSPLGASMATQATVADSTVQKASSHVAGVLELPSTPHVFQPILLQCDVAAGHIAEGSPGIAGGNARSDAVVMTVGDEGPSFRYVIENAGSSERHFWAVAAGPVATNAEQMPPPPGPQPIPHHQKNGANAA